MFLRPNERNFMIDGMLFLPYGICVTRNDAQECACPMRDDNARTRGLAPSWGRPRLVLSRILIFRLDYTVMQF